MPKPDLRPIAVSNLVVDPDIQRGLDQRRVSKIAEDLETEALGVITVSLRSNGNYHIVDGQHRVAAVKLAGGEAEKVLCRVFTGLPIEDEAKLFRLLNNTAKPQALDLFRVRVIEGEPVAVDIDRIVTGFGWRIAQQSDSNAFAAVAAIERVYRLDSVAAEKVVATVTRSWGHGNGTGDGRVIEGIGLVYARYGVAVDAGDLVDRLARYPGGPGALIGKARGLRDLIGGTTARALAEIVVELYNARRKTKALPAWRS